MDLREEIATLRALAIVKGGLEERKAVDMIEIALAGAAPVYPDTLGGQKVMQPAKEVRMVVTPSGYADRVYNGHLASFERIVRYTLAAPGKP